MSDWSGQDWAEYHQRNREAVSRFFAGVDDDIREIFFNLEESQLRLVFSRYEARYGKGARQYAQRVFKKWETGKVRMSGQISLRLLQFLPPLLTFDQRCDLIGKLWEKTQPKRTLKVIVTPNTDFDRLVQTTWKSILKQHESSIPERIKGFLAWLTKDDATVAEALVKHVSLQKNQILLDTLRDELSRVLDHADLARGLQFVGIKTLHVGQLTIKLRCSREDSVLAALWRIVPW